MGSCLQSALHSLWAILKVFNTCASYSEENHKEEEGGGRRVVIQLVKVFLAGLWVRNSETAMNASLKKIEWISQYIIDNKSPLLPAGEKMYQK